MYLAASLLVAFAITILLLSKIANMLNAKRPDFGWVIFASVIGVISSAATMLSLSLFVKGLDPFLMLTFTLAITFIVSSAAYKYINKLSWSGAFTLNVASLAISTLGFVAAVVLNGESLSDSLDWASNSVKENTSTVRTMAASDFVIDENGEIIDPANKAENSTAKNDALTAESEMLLADEKDSAITELDLLPARAVRDIKRKQKRVYVEPKFRVISIGNIHSAIGRRIRISRKNGNTITGGLKRVSGNDAVISQYTSRGIVVMPITMSKIHKLEVYR